MQCISLIRGAYLVSCGKIMPRQIIFRPKVEICRHSSSASSNDDGSNERFDVKFLPQIKRSLKASGRTFKDGFTSIRTECPVCVEDSIKSSTFVYINKTTGSLICPMCQHTERWENIVTFFNGNKNPKKDADIMRARQKFLISKQSMTDYKSPYRDNLKNFNTNDLDINLILNKTEFAKFIPQLNVHNTKYNEINNSLHVPLLNSDNIVVGEKVIDLSNPDQEYTLPSENCSGLLIHKQFSKESTKAIIVLNAKDFLALSAQKLDAATVICIPYGLKSLPQECLPSLEPYKELILWFDFDTSGWDSAINFARKLNEKRCLFIRPTSEHPTPYLALTKGFSLKSILQKATPILHKSITTFSSLKQDVLSELQNIEKVNGVKWKRFPTLNKLLKGHRKGELTILTGPTGSGKTTFMSEYSLDLAIEGVVTLWGSFEIRNTRLASTLLRQFVGYPLDDKLEEFEHWSEQMEKLPIYFMTFHGQESLKIVMDAIEHAQYVYDIHHVIIDNVQFMMGIASNYKSNDKFWEQDAIIAGFRKFATKHNVHVTLVMHPRKERDSDDLTTSSIFGSAKATQEADNVLIIQDKRLTSVRGKKFLQVAKNRYSGDLGIMPLEFNKDGLSYASKRKDKS